MPGQIWNGQDYQHNDYVQFFLTSSNQAYILYYPLQVEIIAYLQRSINIVQGTVIETIDKNVQCK